MLALVLIGIFVVAYVVTWLGTNIIMIVEYSLKRGTKSLTGKLKPITIICKQTEQAIKKRFE